MHCKHILITCCPITCNSMYSETIHCQPLDSFPHQGQYVTATHICYWKLGVWKLQVEEKSSHHEHEECVLCSLCFFGNSSLLFRALEYLARWLLTSARLLNTTPAVVLSKHNPSLTYISSSIRTRCLDNCEREHLASSRSCWSDAAVNPLDARVKCM